MRAIECPDCGDILQAVNDEALATVYVEHMGSEHDVEVEPEDAEDVVAEDGYDADEDDV